MPEIRYTSDLNLNTETVSDTIDELANTLEHYAKELHRTADSMRDSDNLDYVALALNTVTNCQANLRLDLIATRMIRVIDNGLKDLNKG